MHVAHLSLTDFRSYPAAELELEPGVTAFVGPNGQGKTNLVEAVGYVATPVEPPGRLRRPAGTARRGPRDRARGRGAGRPAGAIELEINPGRSNRARLNRSPVPRARDVLGLLRSVLFAPEDLAMVKGDPAERRRFLDELLVARAPRFAGVRADYERVLKQRGALLRAAAAARAGRGRSARRLEDEAAFAAAGAGDVLEHTRGVGRAPRPASGPSCSPPGWTWWRRCGRWWPRRTPRSPPPPAPPTCATAPACPRSAGRPRCPPEVDHSHSPPEVDGSTESTDGGRFAQPTADGRASGPAVPGPEDVPEAGPADRAALAAALREALLAARPAELERGVNLVGPHRDDLELRLGDLPARGYASHGESWSFALALRLAAYELLRADGGGDPVLILDDVFAELDTFRRRRLAEIVAPAEQVLITAAAPEDVPAELRGARFDVAEGRVTRVR